MAALVYILMSLFEGFVVFYFAFSVFRINIKECFFEIIITNILISVATYFYSLDSVTSNLTPLLNMMTLTIFLIALFRVSSKHAFFASALTLSVFLVIQSISVWIVYPFTGLTLENIKSDNFLRYTYQAGSDMVIFLIANLLVKKRLWFSFISYNFTIKFAMTKNNILITVIPSCIMLIAGFTYDINNLLLGSIVWTICFINLLFMGIKMERQAIEK
ncbi:hypothetical protein ABHN03_25430 [Paenibacillus sp. NRS-1775]|uniref:hypothetical protein n=1 Tax=unclassified Paenibacillus TaxID=185978 RepID=UPI003D2B678C